ncbi:MAG: peptide-binding protein, partial [Bosea sp. (in: a-proteobacteria)]
GTPLNIRGTPIGAVVGRMTIGVQVAILDYAREDRGRPWALVRLRGGNIIEGWVFREFVTCY